MLRRRVAVRRRSVSSEIFFNLSSSTVFFGLPFCNSPFSPHVAQNFFSSRPFEMSAKKKTTKAGNKSEGETERTPAATSEMDKPGRTIQVCYLKSDRRTSFRRWKMSGLYINKARHTICQPRGWAHDDDVFMLGTSETGREKSGRDSRHPLFDFALSL